MSDSTTTDNLTSKPTNNSSTSSSISLLKEDLPLDWTRLNQKPPISSSPKKRYPQDVVPPDTFSNTDTTYIEIVGTAGQKITDIGNTFHTLVHAKETSHLILRSHLIQSMEGIKHFPNLHLLELYDNQIEILEELGPTSTEEEKEKEEDVVDTTSIQPPQVNTNGEKETTLKESHHTTTLHTLLSTKTWPGKSIHTLDLSYNAIRSMEPIQYCINLQVLYLANNKIKEMTGLKYLTQLRILDLGANRIRIMDVDQLSSLTNLQQLWLGKNKITDICGLDTMNQLKQLDIQCNRLVCVNKEQLQYVSTTLEELYLADNAIDDMGLEIGFKDVSFPKLTTLDVSRNQLTTCQSMIQLTSLTDLWLSGNKITTFDQINPLRHLQSSLQSIYLEYNPIYQDFEYRKKIKALLPNIEQIDAVRIDGGYGMTWTSSPSSTTITSGGMCSSSNNSPSPEKNTEVRQSILKPTSLGGMKQLQDLIMKRAKEETEKKTKMSSPDIVDIKK